MTERIVEMVPCPFQFCGRFIYKPCPLCDGTLEVPKDVAAIWLGLRQPITERISKN